MNGIWWVDSHQPRIPNTICYCIKGPIWVHHGCNVFNKLHVLPSKVVATIKALYTFTDPKIPLGSSDTLVLQKSHSQGSRCVLHWFYVPLARGRFPSNYPLTCGFPRVYTHHHPLYKSTWLATRTVFSNVPLISLKTAVQIVIFINHKLFHYLGDK